MKQPKRSYVWMFCEQLSPKLVQCKLCGSNFKYHNSTTALRSHLQTKHPEEAANDTNEPKPPKAKRTPNFSSKAALNEEDGEHSDDEDGGKSSQKQQRKNMRPRKYQRQSLAEDDFSDLEEQEDFKPIVVAQTNGVTKKRSIIWHFMVKQSPTECICSICQKIFHVKQGSTTNMMKHLEVSHAEELENAKILNGFPLHPTPTTTSNFKAKPRKSQLSSSKLKVSVTQRQPRGPDFASSKKCLPYLVNMIVKDLHPCGILESQSFQRLINLLNPKVSLPNQIEIKRNIADLHRKHRTLLQGQINEAPGVSLTTEVWTYRERREYLTVTGHFVSKNWELQSVVLKTVLLDTRSIAELSTNIAHEIDYILKEWNITDKAICIVTDPTEALATAVAQVKKPHVLCIAHALNLVVETSLKELIGFENIAERIRDVIDFVDHSAHVSQKLGKTQTSKPGEVVPSKPNGVQTSRPDEIQVSKPGEFEPSNSNDFHVLKPVDFQASKPENFQSAKPDSFQTLKAIEFEALKPVEFQGEKAEEFQVLNPDEMQDKNPEESPAKNPEEIQAKKAALDLKLDTELNWMSTYNMFKNYSELHDSLRSILQEMNKEYILLQPNELELVNQCIQVLRPFALAVEDMTSDVYTSLSKSLPVFEILQQMVSNRMDTESDTDALSALSAELNEQLSQIMRSSVRNKANLLSFTSTLLDPRFKHIVSKDSDMLEEVEANIQDMMDTKDPDANENLNSLATSDIDPNSLWSSFDLTVKKSVSESPVNELHRYLEESPVRRMESPLMYWREREVLYPKLVNIVKTFLSIPATSVPPKFVFSAEEKAKLIRRTFLDEENLDSILFLSSCQEVV